MHTITEISSDVTVRANKLRVHATVIVQHYLIAQIAHRSIVLASRCCSLHHLEGASVGQSWQTNRMHISVQRHRMLQAYCGNIVRRSTVELRVYVYATSREVDYLLPFPVSSVSVSQLYESVCVFMFV